MKGQYTEEQLELKKYLEERNAKRRKEMEAAGATFYTLPMEDLDKWIEAGINNIAEYLHDEAASIHSDMCKERYGMRMRYPYSEMTTEDINEDIDRMVEHQRLDDEHEKKLQAEEQKQAEERKKANKYQGNFAFSGLDSLMK